jgi:AhpD family alkylhydroperoxidase
MPKLEQRTKELIAVGASVAANCASCLEFHVAKAREAGAEGESIREAIETGRLVRQGAATKLDRLAASLTGGPPTSPSRGDCGCGSVAGPEQRA